MKRQRKRVIEAFQSAQETIGTIEKDYSLFAITRGQFSMIDAILATLEQVQDAEISLWTWVIAEYEAKCFQRLIADKRIKSATLMIDRIAKDKNRELLIEWKKTFGENSIRLVYNHSKIACIKNDKFKVLLRGSMNLNYNPRFEQLDITEGGEDFELVKKIESELPYLNLDASISEIHKASGLNNSFSNEQLNLFHGVKVWNK